MNIKGIKGIKGVLVLIFFLKISVSFNNNGECNRQRFTLLGKDNWELNIMCKFHVVTIQHNHKVSLQILHIPSLTLLIYTDFQFIYKYVSYNNKLTITVFYVSKHGDDLVFDIKPITIKKNPTSLQKTFHQDLYIKTGIYANACVAKYITSNKLLLTFVDQDIRAYFNTKKNLFIDSINVIPLLLKTTISPDHFIKIEQMLEDMKT